MVTVKQLREKPKKKTFKDWEGHKIEFLVAGDYESIVLSCESCGLEFTLTKKEVEGLG